MILRLLIAEHAQTFKKKSMLYKSKFFASLSVVVSLILAVSSASIANAGVASGDRVQPLQDILSELMASTSSTSFNVDAPFALPKGFTASSEGPILLDMNGDGLTDIIQAGNNSFNGTHFVLLNTGDGFEVAYSCYIDLYANPDTYQGTCANV